ncbi:MAG: hypothetical protein HRT88_21685 [Lentisphaeraceae bacterium]|nr:hypothetical protein [Lentisphaeraceae bacterium]
MKTKSIKQNHFTLVEAMIAMLLISMSIYAFNISLSACKKSIIANKVKLTSQSLAFDYAKRISVNDFDALMSLYEANDYATLAGHSAKQVTKLYSKADKYWNLGHIPPAQIIDAANMTGAKSNLDLSPRYSGTYKIVLMPIEGTSQNGDVVTEIKIIVTVDVSIEAAGFSNISVSSDATTRLSNF